MTELLGIRYPIVNAPMTPQAGGALARAVTDAGGLGVIGFDESESVESLRRQILLVREDSPERAFGIGLVHWVINERPELFDLALACKPRLVSISFGDPEPYVKRLRNAGILVGAQIQSCRQAREAEAAGVDVIIAQGTEAGGHTGEVGTLPLLQLVLDVVKTPVLAAGGIASGRRLAAVLAAGADGAWIGTPFLLARESRTTAAAQAKIIASDETQTILTSVFDRIQHKPWPAEYRGRALRNDFTQRWHGREEEMMLEPEAARTYQVAKNQNDYAVANVYAGQSVGALHAVTTADEIITRISLEAKTCLLAASQRVCM